LFPSGTRFVPYTLLRSISDQAVSVTPTLRWMQGSVPQSMQTPQVTILPYHTLNLNLASLVAGSKQKTFKERGNVTLNFEGRLLSLLIASGSVDEKNTYVFEVN